MHYISKTLQNELLKCVPDFTSWDESKQWLEGEIQFIQQLKPEVLLDAEFTFLDWSSIEEKEDGYFGLYTSQKWRKFVLATFVSDLVSYKQPLDRVNFERLLFVMHGYPQGFRTVWIKLTDHHWHPVGYTGWYPMLQTTFALFEKKPATLKDRLVAPCKYSENSFPYLYLFNYSAAPILKKSALTSMLMKNFSKDILLQNAAGLACITVSEEGARIAKRFGMTLKGYFCLGESTEGVYTST